MGRITLKQFSKAFGDVEVIPPLGSEINDGEFVVFVGPSGCGKSTLLRLIAGLEDTPAVNIASTVRTPPNCRRPNAVWRWCFKLRALSAYVGAQEHRLSDAHGGDVQGGARQPDRSAAKALNLTDYLDRRPGQLSGGQRQRVAIGRAIVREPSRSCLMNRCPTLTRLCGSACGWKFPSCTNADHNHDLCDPRPGRSHDHGRQDRRAASGRDRTGRLAAGTLPTPRNNFVAGFIGSPKMNLIDGPEAAKHGATTIGIRPEHIAISPMQATWKGTVGVPEHLGSDTFFHVTVEGFKTRSPCGPRARSTLITAIPSISRPDWPTFTGSTHRDFASHDPACWQNRADHRGRARYRSAFAKAYLSEGARVAIADINIARAQAAASELGDAGYAVEMDVTHKSASTRCEANCCGAGRDRHPDQQRRALFRRPHCRDHPRRLSPRL